MPVNFFNEDISFNLESKQTYKAWIKTVVKDHGYTLGSLNYIFCSDEYLLNINKEYLNHDYFTDIITFDQSEGDKELSGDLYISIDRIKDNSSISGVSFSEELRRVIIHGVLHLMGFGDNDRREKEEMRKREDACLSLYQKG